MKINIPKEYVQYVSPKGFISVDGTSLTICEVHKGSDKYVNDDKHVNNHKYINDDDAWFTFMLITHTQSSVIVPSKTIGDYVNLEFDILAKMVERSLSGYISDFTQRLIKLEQHMNEMK